MNIDYYAKYFCQIVIICLKYHRENMIYNLILFYNFYIKDIL